MFQLRSAQIRFAIAALLLLAAVFVRFTSSAWIALTGSERQALAAVESAGGKVEVAYALSYYF
jgi:hypothetical protein